MSKTIVVMAAGLATRYGGNKQFDGMGPNGEMLMEYTAKDAFDAGFKKLVVIVPEHVNEAFVNRIRERIDYMEVSFAVQSFDSLPEWFAVPKDRKRPYGTLDAIICAKDYIQDKFAVVNADDYDGKQAWGDLCALMDRMSAPNEGCMVTYPISSTISGDGAVTRGLCHIENGQLVSIKETYNLKKHEGAIYCFENESEPVKIADDTPCSMNIFGFSPELLDPFEDIFNEFLRNTDSNDLDCECPIPVALGELLAKNEIKISAAPTTSSWFGVTSKEDRAAVVELLRDMKL